MASTLYENICPEPRNLPLSSDTDGSEETRKLKLAEEESDDGFEEMHVKRSSGEFEDKELSVTTFQNGHEHNGINGIDKHNEHEETNEREGQRRSSDNNDDDNEDDDNVHDEDDDDNGHDNDDGDEGEYGEQVNDELQTTSAEFTFTDEIPVATPFYGKTYVAPEYMNFQVAEEDVNEDNKIFDHDGDSKTKESDDFVTRTPDDEKLCDNEPERIEVKNHSEHTAKDGAEQEGGDDTTLSEEASSENEDEGEVQVEELMKDDELETVGDDKIPRLDQADGDDDEVEDAKTGQESTLEHSDSLHLNVPLSPTPDTTEVDGSQGSPDDEDDDLKFEKQNKEIHLSEKPMERLSMVESDEEEGETCSLKIGKDASAVGMASEDLGETIDLGKEDESETEESNAENESGQTEDHLCENVLDRSMEEERRVGTNLRPLEMDSGIRKDSSEGIYSELEPEEESVASEVATDERIELSPINEGDDMEDNFDYDSDGSYPVHRELQTDDADSDLSGKVKELGRIFEGGGPVYPKSTPNPETPDGTPVSVRKFKALFEQDRSSLERAREPVRREELMTPPRGLVKNLRGLFENPEGFQAKKG